MEADLAFQDLLVWYGTTSTVTLPTGAWWAATFFAATAAILSQGSGTPEHSIDVNPTYPEVITNNDGSSSPEPEPQLATDGTGGLDGGGTKGCDASGSGSFEDDPQAVSPVGEVLREAGVRIVIYSNDHAPPHAHVIGGGAETRIGQNGKPLAGDPELSRQQQKVVDNNIATIRKAIEL